MKVKSIYSFLIIFTSIGFHTIKSISCYGVRQAVMLEASLRFARQLKPIAKLAFATGVVWISRSVVLHSMEKGKKEQYLASLNGLSFYDVRFLKRWIGIIFDPTELTLANYKNWFLSNGFFMRHDHSHAVCLSYLDIIDDQIQYNNYLVRDGEISQKTCDACNSTLLRCKSGPICGDEERKRYIYEVFQAHKKN